EMNAAVILSQILEGLQHAHAHGIMHRDIKPDNILFQHKEGLQLQITDWGLSHPFRKGEFLQEIAGTAQYISPQVLNRRYGTCIYMCKYTAAFKVVNHSLYDNGMHR